MNIKKIEDILNANKGNIKDGFFAIFLIILSLYFYRVFTYSENLCRCNTLSLQYFVSLGIFILLIMSLIVLVSIYKKSNKLRIINLIDWVAITASPIFIYALVRSLFVWYNQGIAKVKFLSKPF